MKIGLIVAMATEKEQLLKFLHVSREQKIGHLTFYECQLGKNEIVLSESGVGKVNAALATSELIRSYTPDCIISTGVAGGIDPTMDVMDVVASKRIVYHDVDCGGDYEYGQMMFMPLYYEADERLLNVVDTLSSKEHIFKGLICSGDKFVSSREDLQIIKNRWPEGKAVEMESGAIGQTCYLYKVPFISFRIISDIPGVENHYATYLDFWGEMANRSFKITKEFLEKIPSSLA